MNESTHTHITPAGHFAAPTRLDRRSIGGHAYAGFTLCLVVLLATMAFALFSLERSDRDVRWVEHSEEVKLRLNQLLLRMVNAQTATRGYLISGRVEDLERYHGAADEASSEIQRLRELTTDNAPQQAELDALEGLIETRFGEMATAIVARERDGFNAAASIVQAHDQAHTMDRVRAEIDEMLTEESKLLRRRIAAAADSRSVTVTTMISGVALCILTAGFSVWRIRREFEYRRGVHLALRESESRFRELADTIDEVFWIATPDGVRVIYISPAYEHLWGRSCASLYESPRDRVDAIHDDDRARVESAFLDCVDRGGFDQTYRVVRPDGSIRWVRDRGFPVRDDDGTAVRVAGIAQDITELKQSADSLNESRERLARAQEAADFGVFDWDISEDFILCDDRYARLFGVDEEWPMLTRADWLERVHPEDRERAEREVTAMLEDGVPYRTEYRILRRDGTTRWVAGQATVLRDDAGVPVRAIGAVADITEHKDAEIALTSSRDFIRMWLDSCTDGAWDWNLDTDEFYMSPSFKQLFGYEDDELANRLEVCRSLMHPDDLAAAHEAIARHTETGEPYNLPIRYLHKDGSTVFVMSRGVAIREPDGRFARMIGTHTDITRLKRVESELVRARINLEATVQARTAELRRTNEELEQFAYAASHDLKTPLVTFLGFLNMLEGQLAQADTDGAQDSIERMQRAAVKMQRLIDDLLEISRVGRINHDAEPIAIADLVREFIEMSQPVLEPGRVCIEIDDSTPVVFGDPTRMRQVLHNLLTNAVKYGCGDDGGTIRVGGHVEGNEACFYVRDDGPGIEQQYQEKVFGLFQRLDSSTEGTGVGLAIVRRAIECQGGRVWVESESGRGATFWVALPCEEELASAA